jgi:hypothetical protein
MADFVTHDGGDLVVIELQRVDDAGEEGDLAARHAEGVHRLRAQQVDLPAPLRRARVEARRLRDQLAGDDAQALDLLRVAV